MIFAHQPMSTKMKDCSVSHNVCTVFKNGSKSISIAFDDSCGRMTKLSRSDMRLFVNRADGTSHDVTDKVFPETAKTGWNVDANLETFSKAWEWLRC